MLMYNLLADNYVTAGMHNYHIRYYILELVVFPYLYR